MVVGGASLAYIPLPWSTSRCSHSLRPTTHITHTNRTQRLRDAIDSRITEEQARQRDSLSRSSSARLPAGGARTGSPSRRTTRPRRNTATPVRGPDPKEFEADLALDDEDETPSTRSGTPVPAQAGAGQTGLSGQCGPGEGPKDVTTAEGEGGETEQGAQAGEIPGKEAAGNQAPSELPPEIKAKLRRLDKMETRYHGMQLKVRSSVEDGWLTWE